MEYIGFASSDMKLYKFFFMSNDIGWEWPNLVLIMNFWNNSSPGIWSKARKSICIWEGGFWALLGQQGQEFLVLFQNTMIKITFENMNLQVTNLIRGVQISGTKYN